MAKSSVLTSGLTFSRITSPAIVGVKFSRMPNSLYCTVTVPVVALDDRDREFAAGEEARFLAVVGDQIRFGEALERARCCSALKQRADVVLRDEDEQVQEVAERQRAARAVVEVGRRELLRRRARDQVCCRVGEA